MFCPCMNGATRPLRARWDEPMTTPADASGEDQKAPSDVRAADRSAGATGHTRPVGGCSRAGPSARRRGWRSHASRFPRRDRTKMTIHGADRPEAVLSSAGQEQGAGAGVRTRRSRTPRVDALAGARPVRTRSSRGPVSTADDDRRDGRVRRGRSARRRRDRHEDSDDQLKREGDGDVAGDGLWASRLGGDA